MLVSCSAGGFGLVTVLFRLRCFACLCCLVVWIGWGGLRYFVALLEWLGVCLRYCGFVFLIGALGLYLTLFVCGVCL